MPFVCMYLLCVALIEPGTVAAAAASCVFRLEVPEAGGPIPGPAG